MTIGGVISKILCGSIRKKHCAENSGAVVKTKSSIENILREKPGQTAFACRNFSDIVSSFGLFLDGDILIHICECTSKEAQRCFTNFSWKPSKEELLAFIAICYARGALGLKNMSVTNIFSRKYGPEMIRGTMARDKFKFIVRFLRFDNKDSMRVASSDSNPINLHLSVTFGTVSLKTVRNATIQAKT